MARIVVQSDDRRVVLDARNVKPADVIGDRASGGLIDRVTRAVQDAEGDGIRATRAPQRALAIAPASGYLDVSG